MCRELVKFYRLRFKFREQRGQRCADLRNRQPIAVFVDLQVRDAGQLTQRAFRQQRFIDDAEFDDLIRTERGDQFRRRAERDDLTMIHNRNAITEPRGFIHIMRRQ